MPCKECGQDKKIVAFGMCQACYHRKWLKENRDKVTAAQKKWRTNHPEKYQAARRAYARKHPEMNLTKENTELRQSVHKGRMNTIYRKHEDDLKDDPERLNIREFVEGTRDDFQFRSS